MSNSAHTLPETERNTVVVSTGKERWVQWTPDQRKIFNAGILIVSGLVTGGILFWIGRKIYRKASSNKEAGKGFDEGDPASVAKRINLAFSNDGWFGTDEAMLRESLITVPSQEFWNKVVKSYWKQYNRNLVDDLESELSSTEFEEMKQIIAGKPKTDRDAKNPNLAVSEYQIKSWANRIHQAFNLTYWVWPYGTDEEAVYQVLKEVPDRRIMTLLEQTYQREYTNSFLDDLNDEMSGSELQKAIQIIQSKN